MKNLQHKQELIQSSESGFTIIESLMAIIIVTILMIGIAPVIALSVATRVQARRVELASQAARSYIDAVRSETITAPTITTTIPDNIAAPSSGTLNCTNNNDYCTESSSASDLFCVDLDEDGSCTNASIKDMVVQAFGFNPDANADADDGYVLAIRIYRAAAFDKTLKQGKLGGQESSFTGGTGLKSSQGPLIEMTTEIITNQTDYNDLCQRLGGCS